MQLSSPHQLTDCISAKQLLQALTTLQQMSTEANNEVQLSFSQQSHSFFNTANNQSKMDFQFYMALKNENKKSGLGQKKVKKNDYKQDINNKKNIQKIKISKLSQKKNQMFKQNQKKTERTVLKQKTNNFNRKQNSSFSRQNISSVQKFKSKSHSPLAKKENVQKSNQPSYIISSHLYKEKKDKQSQQNIPKPHQSNISSVKISQVSKKIMIERQRKGKTYVPIQERTNQLIKEKQQKIAKIQRANLALKQFQQRQCTFKPSINNYKKQQKNLVPNRHKTHANIEQLADQQHHSVDLSKQKRQKTWRSQQKTQKIQKIQTKKQQPTKAQQSCQEVIVKNRIMSSRCDKRKQHVPKNEKFNILLDLIN